MKLRFVFGFPLAYSMISVYLIFGPPGGAGHGWGIKIAYYLALPASVIMRHQVQGVAYLLILLGIFQYAVIGLLADMGVRKLRRK